jgi:hypothetical protein
VPEANTASRSNQASHFSNCKEKRMEWLKISARIIRRGGRSCCQSAAEDLLGMRMDALKNRMHEKEMLTSFPTRLRCANV